MSLRSPINVTGLVAVSVVAACAGVVLFALPSPAAAQLSQGERLWFQCRACHTLKAAEPHKLGPNLHGFMNKPVATRPGFRYSKALDSSKLVWDTKTLDKWIERPNDVLTGHRMSYVGMKDAQKRAVLIKFLNDETR